MYKPYIKKLNNRLLLLVLFSVTSITSWAINNDLNQELSIDANRQSADLKKKIFSYIDNVVIKQGSLTIKADLVQVITAAKTGDKTYIAKGKPATFEQTLEDGKPISLQANQIKYEPALNTIVISGNALLKQDGSEVSGSKITYNSETEYVNAESSKNNKVKTIIKAKDKSVKPTPQGIN